LDDEDDSLYFSDVVFAGAGPLQRLPMVLSGEIFRGLMGCFRKFGDIITKLMAKNRKSTPASHFNITSLTTRRSRGIVTDMDSKGRTL